MRSHKKRGYVGATIAEPTSLVHGRRSLTLAGVLKKRGYSTAVGDEGSFAPSLESNDEALQVVMEAITGARLEPHTTYRFAATMFDGPLTATREPSVSVAVTK